jgi:hypothetical protein
MQLRNAFVAPRMVASVRLSTSARKVALSERSQSLYCCYHSLFSKKHSIRYLVYNLRKRGGDSVDKYFKSTKIIASV